MNNKQQIVINKGFGLKFAYQYKQIWALREKVHYIKIDTEVKDNYIERIKNIDYKVSNYDINNKIIQELNRELDILEDFVNE